MNTTIKTRIISEAKAREALLRGVNIMADAVGSTLGPRGQNVAIGKGVPSGEIYERIVLHDGVSVARNIYLEDEFENMGAQLLKQASQKQVDQVGDGTTVVMILARAIINECLSLVASGVNPMSLRRGLEENTKTLTSKLEELAIPVNGHKDLEYIATISAGDKELGLLVADILEKVGKDGIVTVEESKSVDTVVEHQEGMQIDKGFLHELFITNPARMEAVLENAYVLVTDMPIVSLVEWGNFFTEFLKLSKTILIISPDISGEAFPLFLKNKFDGAFLPLCVQAPSMGVDQKNILRDIATLTGARYLSSDAAFQWKDLKTSDLGFAQGVTSTKNSTIIAGGRGKKEEIDKRIESIRHELEDIDDGFDKERMRARLGKLTQGVAVIRVGGLTEVEMKERRERVLDSVAATKAAMEKGIVPGGEIVYLRIRDTLNTKSPSSKILHSALYEPFKKLITNADLDEIDIAIKMNAKGENFGVDVTDGQIKDLIKEGIVDPVLVPINAIQNAVSVAVQIITTGTIINPVPPEEANK